MQKSLWGSVLLIVLSVLPVAAQSGTLPANWNVMDAQAQAAWLCANAPTRARTPCAAPAEQRRPATSNLPPNWNLMSSVEQARWLSGGVAAPIVAAPPCGRACGELWTAADFEASRREIERLERAIAQGESYLQQRRPAPIYQPYAAAPVYRPYVPPPAVYVPRYSTATAARGSSTTFYSGSNGVTGTATSIPPFDFYNFSNGVSGTATTISPFTFYNFTAPRGKTTTGTTTTIGPFDFHNFSNGVNGTSTTIGGTTFHNFSNGKTCTTQTIGASTFTNCN
jgi:hypothetical protein